MNFKNFSVKAALFLLFLISFSTRLSFTQSNRPSASAALEIGADSYERRYFRPRILFDFPLRYGRLYLSMDYLQRINSRLRGEIDFWLSTGFFVPISHNISWEGAVRHLCRHKTLTEHPNILDINEVIGRIWWKHKGLQLGLGAGDYLGPSDGHSNLLLGNLEASRLFNSALSVSSEIKWIDMNKLRYDLELSLAVSPALDLFVRAAEHYRYEAVTYMGLRINTAPDVDQILEKVRMDTMLYPDNEDYKAAAGNEFKLRLREENGIRLILIFQGSIPILKGKRFFGPFRPEKIDYPLALEYEKLLADDCRIYGYGKYEISMPMDQDKEFTSGLGIGIGFRNSPHFDRLDRPLRWDIYGGKHFRRAYDTGFRIGLNPRKGAILPGGSLIFRRLKGETRIHCEIFLEFGGSVKVRPLLAVDRIDSELIPFGVKSRISIGLKMIYWN